MRRRRMRGTWHRYISDRRASVLVLFTILTPVLLGMIGLAVDGGRAFILQTTLQDIADAAALAGATELDATATAQDRARDKALNFLANSPKFANSAAGAQIDSVNIDFYAGPTLCAADSSTGSRIRC